jgi:CubicO group peptidase (beta-lactamase class C family)
MKIISLFAFGVPISLASLAAGQALPRSTPEAQGVSSPAIEGFVKAADKRIHELHSFMLVRHGYVVAEGWWKPHSPEERHQVYSISKSFTSTAVGMAISEGRLSLDDSVLKFFPEYAPAAPSANLSAMRVRDLLTLTGGHSKELTLSAGSGDWLKRFFAYPVKYPPGTHWLYDSSDVYVLSAIVQKVTGQTLLDYLHPRLFDPLGIDDPTWAVSPQGIDIGASGLKLRTEDLAKFGQLYLQNGKWQGKQLVPASWIAAATSKEVPNDDDPDARQDIDSRQGYGFLFWRLRHNGFRAGGANGQFSIVLPDQDSVVAITANTGAMAEVVPLVFSLLLPALHAEPLPPDNAGARSLGQTLSGLSVRGR